MPLNDFMKVFLPYCLKRQSDKTYVVVNREYKPLGFKKQGLINYDNYPVAANIVGLTAKIAIEISITKSDNIDYIQLYDEASDPIKSKSNMEAYLKRLERLAKLEVK